MADLPPIRTPLSQHWKRIRFQVVPVVTMGLSLLATILLWRQTTLTRDIVGEVHMSTASASSLRDGILLRQPNPRLYERYQAGDVVARLDSAAVQAEFAALQPEIQRVGNEMPQSAGAGEAAKLALQVENLRLKLVGASVVLESSRLALVEAEAMYKGARDANDIDERDRLKDQTDSLKKSVAEQKGAVDRLTQEFRAARDARKAELPAEALAKLTPLRDSLVSLETRLAQAINHANELTIRAPITGKVVSIFKHPGQSVSAGEAILTMAREQGTEIIAYVRQEQGLHPAANELVYIRSRSGGPVMEGQVDKVGPALQPVPLHQLRNPKVEEWGVPVTILVRESTRTTANNQRVVLRPGELMDVRFSTSSAAPAAAVP